MEQTLVADAGRLDYADTVLRRTASLFVTLALFASPAVTSTRFFCQFTGEEIVGCAEIEIPQQAQIRTERCCEQRTFHALDGARLLDDQREQAAAPVALDAAPPWVAAVLAVATSAVRLTAAPSIGPPAFLSHRALLI